MEESKLCLEILGVATVKINLLEVIAKMVSFSVFVFFSFAKIVYKTVIGQGVVDRVQSFNCLQYPV